MPFSVRLIVMVLTVLSDLPMCGDKATNMGFELPVL